MTNGHCDVELCPRHYGQHGCPLADALAHPTSTDPKKDDRAENVRAYKDCADFGELKKRFPGPFRRAGF